MDNKDWGKWANIPDNITVLFCLIIICITAVSIAWVIRL